LPYFPRTQLTNHHKGNKRFRDIVALHRPDYVRAPKIQKPSVARVIVRAIRNGDPPGRFLRKDDRTGKWIDVGDKKAAEKTSQALREKPDEEPHEQGVAHPGSHVVLESENNDGDALLLPPVRKLVRSLVPALVSTEPGGASKPEEAVEQGAEAATLKIETPDEGIPISTAANDTAGDFCLL
jgi:hypothetical protein